MPYQLDFLIEEKSEIAILHEEIEIVRSSSDKVRKSIYARHGELARKYADLHDRMQILEKNICLGVTTK